MGGYCQKGEKHKCVCVLALFESFFSAFYTHAIKDLGEGLGTWLRVYVYMCVLCVGITMAVGHRTYSSQLGNFQNDSSACLVKTQALLYLAR